MTSDPKSVAPPSESAAPEKEIANLLGRGHVENPREGEPGDAETYSEPVAPAPICICKWRLEQSIRHAPDCPVVASPAAQGNETRKQ